MAVLPIGQLTIRFAFNRTGPYRGTGALFALEQALTALPANGLDIGLDRGLPVSAVYPAPFPFTVERVVYQVSAGQ